MGHIRVVLVVFGLAISSCGSRSAKVESDGSVPDLSVPADALAAADLEIGDLLSSPDLQSLRRALAFGLPRSVPLQFDVQAAASGDFDEDGHLDLALVNFNDPSVSIFIGDGTGGFAVGKHYAVHVGGAAAAVADVDGDGHLDIVVPSLEGAFTVWS